MANSKFSYYAEPEGGTPRLSNGTRLRHTRQLQLRPEEEEELPRSFDFHAQVFDMSKSDDVAAYGEVMDMIINRDARQVGPEQILPCPARETFLVFLRWAIELADLSPALRNRLGA